MIRKLLEHIKAGDLSSLIRFSIRLNFASLFHNDKQYLTIMGEKILGYKLNLDNPKTFNEKLNWIKLNTDSENLSNYIDKITAKRIASSIIGQDHIIPTIAVYDTADQIDFSVLPDKFVLKCNHDSGSVIVVRDKKAIDEVQVRKKLSTALNTAFSNVFREYAYKKIERKIICEEYMEQRGERSLIDYKFFCFNGEAKFLYVSQGLENHATATVSFYDLNMNLLPFHRSDFKQNTTPQVIPQSMNEMIFLANRLAKDFPFVRIDLYSINNKVYFSEYTFTPCAGFLPFEPIEYDSEIGGYLDLSAFKKGQIEKA